MNEFVVCVPFSFFLLFCGVTVPDYDKQVIVCSVRKNNGRSSKRANRRTEESCSLLQYVTVRKSR